MARVLVNESNLQNIADAIRAKNGSSDTYIPAQMASAIAELQYAPWLLGDIPDYVKAEAMAVAEKVKAVQTANTITSIVWADAHHTKDQVTGWQAQPLWEWQ